MAHAIEGSQVTDLRTQGVDGAAIPDDALGRLDSW
jgi:hypothetical protein